MTQSNLATHTETALDVFERDGVVVVKNAVRHDVIDAALEEIDRFRANNADWLKQDGLMVKDRLFRVINFHCLLPSLRKIFNTASPEVMEVVDSIGGGTLYTSLYFETGSEQTFHRDTPYFWTNPPFRYLGFWVAMEDIDEDNGPLQAIPGSHKFGEPDREALRREALGDAECPPSHTPLFDAYNKWANDKAIAAGLESKKYCIKKGDAIVWNASTLHGGAPHINSDKSRKSFVMHVTAKSVPVLHMNYYFHPEREMPDKAPWGYFSDGNREYADHGTVGFMHKVDYPVSRFDSDYRLIPDAIPRIVF